MIRARVVILALSLVALHAVSAAAQASTTAGRVEVTGGARWIGPIDFTEVYANEVALGGGTRSLFRTATTLDGSIGASGSVGVRLSQQFQVELAVAWNPTSLTTRVSSDVEGIPDVSVDAPVTQFLMEGGVLVRPGAWRARRVTPFLTAGAGYLRQLNDGRTLVETGRSYYIGGGLYYERATGGRRRMKASGVRLDVRGLMLQDGVSPGDTLRLTPAVSAALFVRF